MSGSTDFTALGLSPSLFENLASLGYHAMTPIQAAALPPILGGRDVIAQAKTGSGKTAAFGLGLLQALQGAQLQALVICPTRELAEQISREIRALARRVPNIKLVTLCGGVPIRKHRDTLQHGAQIVVGTPGRLRALQERGDLQLGTLRTLVLDEADRMLELGFEDDLRTLLQAAPRERQTLLFSATYPPTIEALSAGYQRDPLRVTVDAELAETQLEQLLFTVGVTARERQRAVIALLQHYQPDTALVFCQTREECNTLAQALRDAGAHALALHSDFEQRERDEVLTMFSNGSCSVLVATDVAARGLDISDLDCVIIYELSTDPSVHVHRVGRTGRAGKQGLALSLYRSDDSMRLERIEAALQRPLARAKLPEAGSGKLRAPSMRTLRIDGGRRDKLRPGDILGALTAAGQVRGEEVGKITVLTLYSFVALQPAAVKRAERELGQGKIKGRRYRVSQV